jgi:hypothetical protein
MARERTPTAAMIPDPDATFEEGREMIEGDESGGDQRDRADAGEERLREAMTFP